MVSISAWPAYCFAGCPGILITDPYNSLDCSDECALLIPSQAIPKLFVPKLHLRSFLKTTSLGQVLIGLCQHSESCGKLQAPRRGRGSTTTGVCGRALCAPGSPSSPSQPHLTPPAPAPAAPFGSALMPGRSTGLQLSPVPGACAPSSCVPTLCTSGHRWALPSTGTLQSHRQQPHSAAPTA